MNRLTIITLLLLAPLAKAQDHVKWFDTQTKIEFSASALAIAADGWTTRVDAGNAVKTAYRFNETNPLARPFVYNDVKASLYFGSAFGTQVVANWILRSHPRARHVLNWSIIGAETFWAARNAYIRRY